MDRSGINAALFRNHEEFIARVLAVPISQRAEPRNGKWSPAQHAEHILRAVRPVAMALLIPKWFLRWRVGVPNRPPRDYEGLVQRYKEKLAAGGRASGRFVPPEVPASAVEAIAASVEKSVIRLTRRVNRWSEHDLDTVLLPHPLLGKVTVREMLYFTIYHIQHHQALVDRDAA
ncbi:MAG TPA: DinB family protein [Flavobacteriales bacterium]|nr:DinB family protein [Flavobacteriales bacterium]